MDVNNTKLCSQGLRVSFYASRCDDVPKLVGKAGRGLSAKPVSDYVDVVRVADGLRRETPGLQSATIYAFDLDLARPGRTASLVAAIGDDWLLLRDGRTGALSETGGEGSRHVSWGGVAVSGARDAAAMSGLQQDYLHSDGTPPVSSYLERKLEEVCDRYGISRVDPEAPAGGSPKERLSQRFRETCVKLMTVLPAESLLDLPRIKNISLEFNDAANAGKFAKLPDADYNAALNLVNAVSVLWGNKRTCDLGELAWGVMAAEGTIPRVLPQLSQIYRQIEGKTPLPPEPQDDPNLF